MATGPSCLSGVCGTGDYAGPQPGDPNNAANFTATAAYGGIDLNWSLPTINPFAVAHVRIYRSNSAAPLSATLLQTIAGDFYFDRVEPNILYYYWLEVVSINGTYSDWIGPESASAMSTIEKTIQDLTGKIDSGVLAIALKDKIDSVTLLGQSITAEVQERMAALAALSGTVAGLQGQVNAAITIVETEVVERIDADGALVTQLDFWAAGFNNSIAGITEEVIIQVGPNSALAQRITTAESSINGDVATGQVGLTTKITTLDGKVVDIGARWTAILNVNGLVGGFGIYNNGQTVQAGFDVDEFWIGRTSADKRKPFIISNGVVYLDDAAINKLVFTKLRDEQGTFIVENGKVKADFIDTKGLIIRDINGNAIFGAGTPLSASLITGLGSLATQNSVASNQVSGLGSLATQSSVYLNGTGSVKFPDGSAVNISDLVTKLSKLDSSNLSLFMNNAAIGTAFIGNAAIGNAQIQDLSVNTIKIGNEAVTIPRVVTASNTVTGNGATHELLTKTITLTSPGTIYAHAIVGINLGAGARSMALELYIAGTSVSRIAGNAETYGLAVAGALENLAAGTYTINVLWNGASGSAAYDRSLFVQGAMK